MAHTHEASVFGNSILDETWRTTIRMPREDLWRLMAAAMSARTAS